MAWNEKKQQIIDTKRLISLAKRVNAFLFLDITNRAGKNTGTSIISQIYNCGVGDACAAMMRTYNAIKWLNIQYDHWEEITEKNLKSKKCRTEIYHKIAERCYCRPIQNTTPNDFGPFGCDSFDYVRLPAIKQLNKIHNIYGIFILITFYYCRFLLAGSQFHFHCASFIAISPNAIIIMIVPIAFLVEKRSSSRQRFRLIRGLCAKIRGHEISERMHNDWTGWTKFKFNLICCDSFEENGPILLRFECSCKWISTVFWTLQFNLMASVDFSIYFLLRRVNENGLKRFMASNISFN